MKINTLELYDVLSWKELSLDFSKFSFTLFKGKCGFGKSNIFDGLTWVLFDRTARKNYDKNKVIRDVPDICKQAVGVLVFKEGDKEYKVTRKRGLVNDLIVQVDGNSLGLRNVTYTQEELQKIIGMDYDTFINIAYFSQADNGKFFSSTSSERINIVSAILSLKDYDKAAKIASDNLSNLNLKIEGERGQIKTYETIVAGVDVKSLNAKRKSNQIELKNVIDELKHKQDYVNRLDEKNKLKQEIDSLKDKYNAEKDSWDRYSNRVRPEIVELEKELKGEVDVMKRLSLLKGYIQEIDIIEQSLNKQQLSIEKKQHEILKLNLKCDSLIEKASEMSNASLQIGGNCQTCFAEITQETISNIMLQSKKYVKKTDNIKMAIDELNTDLVPEKNNLRRLNNELLKHDGHKKEQASLIERLKSYSDMKDRCQRLKIKLVDEKKLVKINLGEIKCKFNDLSKHYKSKYSRIDSSNYDKYSLDIKCLEDKSRSLSIDIETLKYQVNEYQKAISALSKLKAQILESQNEADKAKLWKHLFPKMKLQVIAQSIPIIQSLINSYLKDLTPGLLVELQVDPASHKKIDIIINKDGRRRIFEGYNVGCQHQLALSSFMSLNKLASLRSGKSVNFLLLDEKFASLDNESRDDVFNLLRHNYKDRKLFAISHLEGIESEFNEVVDVKFLNGVSSL